MQFNSAAYLNHAPEYVRQSVSTCVEYLVLKVANTKVETLFTRLLQSEKLLSKDSDNEILQRGILNILLELNLPTLAADIVEKSNHSFTQKENTLLYELKGAEDINWSETDSELGPNRYLHVDRAIAQLKKILSYARRHHASEATQEEIQEYLIQAYQQRRYWDKAIFLYEDLSKASAHLSTLTRVSAAFAYLGFREYAKAEVIFQALVDSDPDISTIGSSDIYLGLYKSILEQDRFDAAGVLLIKLSARLQMMGKTDVEAQSRYTQTRIDMAYEQAYQDKNGAAEAITKDLFNYIPANIDLLKASGDIAAWQLSPRRAENYFKMALGQSPRDINANIGYVNARMDQGDIDSFTKVVNAYMNNYSDIETVKEASQRLSIHNMSYVTGNFEMGNGYYGVEPNNNWTGDLRVYSSLIDEKYRLFTRYRGLYSGPAVPAQVNGYGGGVRFEGIDQTIELEAGDAGYSRIEGTKTLDDHWSINAVYERNSFLLEPGSLFANIAGNMANVNLRWHNNDITEGLVGYRYWTFPGNVKQEQFASLTQRLWTEYNYKIDLEGWIGSQQNNNQNVSYFSPINQTEYSTNLSIEILQWRDLKTKQYEFWHKFWGGYGMVTQAGYATLPMNNYGYGQEFKIGRERTLSWGVGRTMFPFDGIRSSYITGYLQFQSQF
ncbi:hypothetical protein G6661_05245 [Polynucleobacter paneuropaeus]|nr:hypothetical protein G6661_05245 [Polynucleobacter paneuropaeus]